MSWTTSSTVTVGQLASAAFWNAQVRDNLAYLHGDAGTIALAAGVALPNGQGLQGLNTNGVGYVPFIPLWTDNITYVGDATHTVKLRAPAGNVQANSLPVHRHADASHDRHMESGSSGPYTVAAGASKTVAVTFVNAYASAPVVIPGVNATGFLNVPNVNGVSATGFTLIVHNGDGSGSNTITLDWISEGAD